MPASYHIDEAQRIVWARGWGVLCDQDLLDQQSGLRADPRFHPSFSQLVDASAVTDVTVSARVMSQMGESTLFAPAARRAYIVTKDVMFGLVRMYALYQEVRGQPSVQVFRDRPAAIAWLGVSDTDPGIPPPPSPAL